jgi:hypothetical protein
VLGVIWLIVRRRRTTGGEPAADAPR